MTTQRNKRPKSKPATQHTAEKKPASSNTGSAVAQSKRVQGRQNSTKLVAAGKTGVILDLLRRPEGTTISDLCVATGWQAHSVRGALSGTIKKKLGLQLLSEKTEAGRVYRIAK